MTSESAPTVDAVPGPFALPPGRIALVVIDMQRDFLLPGGFGETLGNDVSQLASVVPPLQRVLAAAREAGLMIIHTREGHEPGPLRPPPRQAPPGPTDTAHRRPRPVRSDPGPRRVRPRHHRRTRPGPRRDRDRQAGQGLLLRHRPADRADRRRHHHPHRHRRDDRGLRAHHRAGGERPRLRGAGALGLRRLLLPGVPADRARHDRRPGRHLRLGHRLGHPPQHFAQPASTAA